MTVDLSKCVYYSGANAFKNDSAVYTGSVSFPTSIPGSGSNFNSTTLNISTTPQFTKFFANFQEVTDATSNLGIGVQWYPAQVAYGSVALTVTTSPFNTTPINGYVYTVINGAPANSVTVYAQVQNPYSSAINLSPLTVPFAFIEYTLAN